MEKSDLDSEFRSRAEELEAQINSLNEDLSAAERSIGDVVRANPLLVLGGTLVAGLLVGLLLGGRRRRHALSRAGNEYRTFIDAYIDAVVDDAKHAVISGEETGEAIRQALQDRVPLIVYSRDNAVRAPGLFRQLLELSVTTGVGFGVRSALERFTSTLNLVQADSAATGATEQDIPLNDPGL